MTTQAIEATSPNIFHLLETCIEVSTDGEKAYAVAAADARAPELKALFHDYSAQRSEFVRALTAQMQTLGGAPAIHGTASGSALRSLMGMRLVVEGNKDEVLLAECERAERRALAAYDRAFRRTPLDTVPTDVSAILVEQRGAIERAHADVLRRLAGQ